MIRKFSTMLVVAAATLLAVTAQAQESARKQVAPKMKVMKLQPGKVSASEAPAAFRRSQQAAKAQARTRTEGRAFRSPQQPLASTAKTQNPVKTPLRDSRVVYQPYAFGSLKAPQRTFRASGEVVDEHGIILSPAEGSRVVYSRSGGMYVNQDGMQNLEQQGNVQLVLCDDGTVYIRNILCSYPTGTWVKGVREGNTISVAMRQPILYNDVANVTYSVGWGYVEYEWGTYSYSYYGGDVATFTVDDEAQTISLDTASDALFLGLFWDDDDAFANYGDYGTVWSYVGPFEPLQTVEVTAPAGVEAQTWYVRAHRTINDARQVVKGTAGVAISGSDIYLKGVFADFADGWMKGTVDADGVVTFDGMQLQGAKDGQPVYAVGASSGDLLPFQMTYDADSQTLSSKMGLLANLSMTEVDAVDLYDDITITLDNPFAPIETLPYENAISTEDEFEMFTVVDANGDGIVWQLYDEEGTNKASIRYNPDLAADDWLISPAFRLEAGKTYSMAIDMNCSSEAYAERFEVKMGAAPTAEAMTQEVIAASTVDSRQAVTFQNKLISVSETGVYYFGIHAISDADQASLRASNLVVDETVLDAPEAVTNLTATAIAEQRQVVIAFTAPAKSIGGSDLSDNMTVTIDRNGETVATLSEVIPGSEQAYVDEDVEPGKYTYAVTTSNTFGKGETVRQTVTLAAVYGIPFVGDFSEEGTYDTFTAINANDDAAYWSDNGFYAAYEYSSDNDADDYLVSPGLMLEAGKRYAISVDAEAAGDYTERFEVVVGREATAEGLTTKVIEPQEIIGSDGRVTYEGVFTCEESGIYYAAVHCISDADMYALWIHKMSVEIGPALTAPAAPELTVTPGAEGALSATISVTAPSVTVGGDPLTDNLTAINVLRDGEVVYTMQDVMPGATLDYVDAAADLTSGLHTYQLIPYNADGIGMKSPQVKAYVGIDTPSDVANVKVKDQQGTVLLTWDAVTTTGQNGGYVNPAEVSYKILACEPNSTYIYETEGIATVQGQTSCELEFNANEGEQGYQGWIVVACNEAGESSISDAQLVTLTTGESYELPFVESFTNGGFHYYCDYVGVPLVFSLSSDDDGSALALTSQQDNSFVALTTGKLNIRDAQHPTLLVDVASYGADNFTILAAKDGDTDNSVTLAVENALTTDYKTVKVDLTPLKDAHYVLLAFVARIANCSEFDPWSGEMTKQGDAIILDNIRVIDEYEHNLAISLSAPETLQAGNATGVVATVTNWGSQPAKDFDVLITTGDEVLFKTTITDELEPFVSVNVTANLATTVFTEEGELTVTAKADYAADQSLADNEAQAVISITAPVAPMPENLVAENNANGGVDLSWNAPTATATYTESFENGMGGWTVIDADQDGHGWTYSKYGETANYMNTNSGLGCVFSESFVNGVGAVTPDNWLVSPKVVLDGELTFYAKGQDPDWCDEHFAVYVSTGDAADPASFTQVMDEQVATSNFEEYTVDLSQYAGQMGHVAIRHFNVTDMFTLVVDDITYTMGGQPTSYHVYYDGQLVATVADGVTTYAAAAEDLQAGEHSFAVSAVYDNGQESRPVITTISVAVGISELAADGKPVDVYSLDGRLVRSQAKSFDGLKGVYVIGGNTVMVK